MPYGLNDDITFCVVDGKVIFLDINNDRYFRLPKYIENSFLAYINGDGNIQEGVDMLLKNNILIDKPTRSKNYISCIELPKRSAIETRHPQSVISILTLLEILIIVCATRVQLETRKLKNIIDDLIIYRQKRTGSAGGHSIDLNEERYLSLANIFCKARPYVPIETSCLLDSLSMAKFYARSHLHVDIVFGITCDPFSAHCWVQAGDLVLNDTVGNANYHTPIRRV